MNHKVTVVVSSLLLLFSQTSVLSQPLSANNILASTPTAQESQSDSSSADAPLKRRSAGTRFIDIQYPDLENNNPNLYYPDAGREGWDSNISNGLEEYKQGNLAAALESLGNAETKLSNSLGDDFSNLALGNIVHTSPTTNLPDRDSSIPTPLPNPQGVEEYAAIANATGLIYRDLKEWEKSEAYFNRALSAFTAIENNIGRSIALTNLGTNYRQLERPQEALNYYHRALEFSQPNSDRHSQKYIFNQIALAYYDAGNKQKSLEYFQRVLAIAEEEDNALDKGIAFNNIGEVYRSLGRKSEARRHYELALLELESYSVLNTSFLYRTLNSPDIEQKIIKAVEENIASISISRETAFTCGNVDGVPTTIASNIRGDIAIISWDSDYLSSTAYTPQQRCETVATRLNKGYQNELKYLTTGVQNGLNVICMTSTNEGSCEEVLLILRPGDDPQQTLQALFNTRTTSSSASLYQSSSDSRFIDLEKYLEIAPTVAR